MKLADFVKSEKKSSAACAREAGIPEATFHLYVKEKRIPRRKYMARIEAWSGGVVTAADFYGQGSEVRSQKSEGPPPRDACLLSSDL